MYILSTRNVRVFYIFLCMRKLNYFSLLKSKVLYINNTRVPTISIIIIILYLNQNIKINFFVCGFNFTQHNLKPCSVAVLSFYQNNNFFFHRNSKSESLSSDSTSSIDTFFFFPQQLINLISENIFLNTHNKMTIGNFI